MDQEPTYIRANSMEQNNTPQADGPVTSAERSESNEGTYEWSKFIVFFAAIILVTVMVIRVIAPFIFTEYVPDIMGLNQTNSSNEPIVDPIQPEDVEPEDSAVAPANTENESEDNAENNTGEEETTEEAATIDDESSNEEGEPEGNSTTEQSFSIYVVRPGETLTSIAADHNLTVEALIAANNSINPNLLKAGQEIQIPK